MINVTHPTEAIPRPKPQSRIASYVDPAATYLPNSREQPCREAATVAAESVFGTLIDQHVQFSK
jgi:hypothetical protein